MSLAASEAPLPRARSRVRWVWILDRRRDLAFYIGSALAGWLYAGLVAWAVWTLDDPLTEPLATLRLGGVYLPLTLELLVVASWALLLDAPHVWATLGRTLADPDEWRLRRRELLTSFAWFGVGPLAILAPYALAAAAPFGHGFRPERLALGAVGFFVFFRIWAYYHVVRQHWGFFSLYKRKAGDYREHRLDRAFFELVLWMPLVLFLTSSYYPRTPGFPALGLHHSLAGGVSLAALLHPLAWTAYLAVLLLYLGAQVRSWLGGGEINGSKLLYMALLIPLHFAAFSHPILAAFVVPLVTVGHNIQYHAIVYTYGRNKYGATAGDRRYRWPRLFFRSLPVYALVGLVFTFGFYRGPWVEWLKEATGLQLDATLLDSLGMMAGIRDPAQLGLGEQVMAALIVGFAMQHYYLDAKIWRVSRDREVQRNLGV